MKRTPRKSGHTSGCRGSWEINPN